MAERYIQVSALYYLEGIPYHICHQFVDYDPEYQVTNRLLERIYEVECDKLAVSIRELPFPKVADYARMIPEGTILQ